MHLYRVIGGTEEDLYAKKYNIGVGISLGNKWFSLENIISLTEWALEHTKDFVVVYVADSIHAINIEVRKRKTFQKAMEMAQKMGDEILKEIRLLAETRFSPNQLSKIHYEKWDSLITPNFQDKLDWLNAKYETDLVFRNSIIEIVNGFTKDENREFSDDDKIKLGKYIILELPEIIGRTAINNLLFEAYAYPYDGELVNFVEKIQKGELFPEIRDKVMDTEPKVMLVVR
jgi:tRNA-dependent cyclodipeptide synthase